MKCDVFISYSNKDQHTADAICSSLENSGIRCWISHRDVFPGNDWAKSINTAIKSSRVMVLVFSENSNNSVQVTKELNLAVHNKLVIIPFKIDNSIPSDGMEYFLADMHWLDAVNGDIQAQIDRLKDIVSKIILTNEPNPNPNPTPKPTPKPVPEPEPYIICAHCGKPIKFNINFCQHCGKAVREQPDPQPPKPQEEKISIFQAYINIWKNAFNFKGVLSRKEYWFAMLIHYVISVIFALMDYEDYVFLYLYTLVSFIPFLSASVRRLHDSNHSGHWYWLNYTVLGALPVLVLLCADPVYKGNRFRK